MNNTDQKFEYSDSYTPKVTDVMVTDDYVSYSINVTGQGLKCIFRFFIVTSDFELLTLVFKIFLWCLSPF